MGKTFWLATLERALKTFAQALLATLGVDAALLSVNWPQVLSVAGGAALLSVLTSIGSAKLPMGEPGSPSLVPEVKS